MKLPVITGRELAKALGKLGFEVDHQTGSHLILRKNSEPFTRVSVPIHSKDLPKGTLRAIMRQVNLNSVQLANLLK